MKLTINHHQSLSTEYPGKFVEHHLKNVANSHESWLQDTPHFLREIEELNQSGKVKDDDILVTVDVCSLYTNLDMTEGLGACREALEDRNDKKVHTDFIIKLLEIILKYNIFEFNEEMFIQMIGTAMGAVPAVSYANITMAKVIDP